MWTRRLAAVAVGALFTAACSGSGKGERPSAQYDPETGKLRRLAYDANKNGRNDAVSVMDGTRIRWIELDLDENGKVDRWDFYSGENTLEKVGFSRQNDGVLDAQAFYLADGRLNRIEISTNRNARFDRVEFYENGALVRSEEDANADGRPDKWETYRPNPKATPGEPPYAITSVAFDDDKRGTPQRRLVYGDGGRVMRVELDPDGDGRFAVKTPTSGDRQSVPQPSVK